MKDSNGVTVQVGDSIETLYDDGVQVVTSISCCGGFWRINDEESGSCSNVTIVHPYTEPAYLTRRAELIEAHELIEGFADIYYEGDDIRAEDLAKIVYPTPRPETLPACKIRLCRDGNTYAIFGNIGRFLIYNLDDHNMWSATDLPNSVGATNKIKLDELERILDAGFTLCDTWSADTKFPELLES